MADFELVLTANSSGMLKGVDAMRALETQAKKTEVATEKVGQTSARSSAAVSDMAATSAKAGAAMSNVSAMSGQATQRLQNFSYQIQDIAVQVGGGTSAFVALGQQLPQILGPLGLAGAALGTLAAVTMPLLGLAFRDFGGEAKTATERLEDANSALKSFKGNAEIAMMAAEDLADRFGRWGEKIKFNAEMMAMQNVANAQAAISSGELVDGLSDIINSYEIMAGAISKLPPEGAFGPGLTEDTLRAKEAVAVLRDNFESAAASIGLTTVQALSLNTRMKELQQAKGPAELAVAADNVMAAFAAIPREVIASNKQLSEAYDQVFQLQQSAAQAEKVMALMPSTLGLAASAARGLAGEMDGVKMAANAALSQMIAMDIQRKASQAAAQRQAAAPGGIGPAGMANGDYAYASDLDRKLAESKIAADAWLRSFDEADKKAGSSGKRGSKAMLEAEKAMKAAKKAAEELQKELEAPMISAIDGVANAFGDFIVNGARDFKSFSKSILDSFKSMISQMIAMAVRNKIMLSIGMGGSVAGTAASAVGMASGGPGIMQGAGLLGGLGNSFQALKGVLGMTSKVNLGGLMSIAGGGTAATGLMAAIPAIGAVVGGIALIGSLFKRKTTASGIQGTYGPDGFSGENFTKSKNFFGSRTRTSALDSETKSAIEDQLDSVRKSVKQTFSDFGISTSALESFSASLKVNTLGMSAEDAANALANAIRGVGDQMVDAVADVSEYQLAGEGSLQTLSRLATSLNAVNLSMAAYGRSLYEVSLAGAGAAQTLIDAFGGMEQYASANDAYFQMFYSETERIAAQTNALQTAMSKLGLTMPGTREGFRALVDAQDLSTEAGRSLYAQLIGMASAFDFILPRIEGVNSLLLNERGPVWRNYSTGGDHPGGFAMVGENGPELVALGRSRVYNATQTASIFSKRDASDLIASELASQRQENRQLFLMLNSSIKRQYDMFKKWDANGLATVPA